MKFPNSSLAERTGPRLETSRMGELDFLVIGSDRIGVGRWGNLGGEKGNGPGGFSSHPPAFPDMTGSRFRPQALQQRSRRFVVGVPGDGFTAEGFGTGMARFLPRVSFIRSTVVPWSFQMPVRLARAWRIWSPAGEPGSPVSASGEDSARRINCPAAHSGKAWWLQAAEEAIRGTLWSSRCRTGVLIGLPMPGKGAFSGGD